MIGRIYVIYSDLCNDVYIGSTMGSIYDRFAQHMCRSNHCKIGKYFSLYRNNDYKIEQIKHYQVVDKNHLHVYETLWLIKFQRMKGINVLNQRMPFGIRPIMNKIQIANITNAPWTCTTCNSTMVFNYKKKHLQTHKHKKKMKRVSV